MAVRGRRRVLPRSGGIWLLRDVREPRRSSSQSERQPLPRSHHGAPRDHYVYAGGLSEVPGNLPSWRALYIGGALQDAVRKISSIGAVRKDGLYVDTLQALSRCR